VVVVVVAVWDRTWTFEIELCNCTNGSNPFQVILFPVILNHDSDMSPKC